MSRILLDQAFAVRSLPSRVHRDLLIYFAGVTHAFSDLMELGLICQLGTTGFWLQLEPEVEV